MFKKLFLSLIGVVLMLVLVALAVPFLIPVDEYKSRILALIEEKTGRKVTVEGSVDFSVLPKLALNLNNVTIANPKGFTSPYFMKIGALSVNLEPWPLLEKKVALNALAISDTTIYAEETASGAQNWQFLPPPKGDGAAKSPDVPGEEKKPLSYDISNIELRNATIHYKTPKQTVSAERVTVTLTPEEMDASVNVVINNLPLTVELQGDTPSHLWMGQAIPLRVNVKGDALDATVDGKLSGVNIEQKQFDWNVSGSLSVKVASVAQLQKKITGHAGDFDKAVMIESQQFSATSKQLSLNTFDAAIADVKVDGSLSVMLGGAVPTVSGDIHIPTLNTQQLALNANRDGVVSSINLPLIASAIAQEKAEKWSTDPIDMAALNAVNGKLGVKIDSLEVDGLKVDGLNIQNSLSKGVLNMIIGQASIAGGTVSGKAMIDASASRTRWTKEITLSNVRFEEVMAPYFKKMRIEGPANATLGFSGSGNSVHDWMHSLSGGGQIVVKDGVIKGYSLSKLFRNVADAFLTPDQKTAVEDTKFTSLSAQMTADNGILTLTESSLDAPLLRATATGTVSLKDKLLDLYLKPLVVPSLKAQSEGNAGLLVPIKVKGSFDNPKITPDLKAAVSEALSDPQKLKDAAAVIREEGREIREQFQGNKKALKEGFEQLKQNKDAGSLGNFLNQLDQSGVKVPLLPNVIKDTSGSTGTEQGAGGE